MLFHVQQATKSSIFDKDYNAVKGAGTTLTKDIEFFQKGIY